MPLSASVDSNEPPGSQTISFFSVVYRGDSDVSGGGISFFLAKSRSATNTNITMRKATTEIMIEL